VVLSPARVRAAELRSLVAREGEAIDRVDLSGAQGLTEAVTLPDGSRFVVKTARANELAAADTVDREELAALVADAVGVRAPVVHRVGPDKFYMDWIEGEPGAGSNRLQGAVAEWRESDSGRLLGLMDTITGNPDRHGSNWILAPDGTVAGVDHGFAFSGAPNPRQFAGHFTTEAPDGSVVLAAANDMSPADLAAIRPRLEALRPEFDRLGHGDWHDEMLSMLDQVSARATGTRNRLGS
jgi:hypothetical protein